jgi:hypothetical protein
MEKTTIFNQDFKSYSTQLNLPIVDISREHKRGYNLWVKKNDKVYFVEDKICDDEETFLESYGNKLHAVSFRGFQVIIEQLGPKVSFKMFKTLNSRKAGRHYFEKKKHMWHLSFNLETGDCYTGLIFNYQRKVKVTRKIRKNVFYGFTLDHIFFTLMDEVGFYLRVPEASTSVGMFLENKVSPLHVFRHEIENILVRILRESFTQKNVYIPPSLSLANHIFLNYLVCKGIKYPNNFDVYQNFWGVLPSIKEYRKSEMKFVDAFMRKHELKGDQVKKSLHTTTRANIGLLKGFIKLFGYDQVVSQKGLIDYLLEYENEGSFSDASYTHIQSFTKKERKNFLEFINRLITSERDRAWFSTRVLRDHLSFVYFLRSQNENVKLKFTTPQDFSHEHDQMAIKVESYKKGIIERRYNPEFLSYIKPFVLPNGDKLIPVVLKTTSDYQEESAFQNNCVRTYAERPSSFIISLRNHTTNERASIEYNISKTKQDKLDLKRVQYLGKRNTKLEGWDGAMDILDKMIDVGLKNTTFDVEIEKTFQNRKKIRSGITFLNGEYPRWENPLEINGIDDPFDRFFI